LTRYRRKLVQHGTQEKNCIHKILQDANIKLTTFVSDLFGVSGHALLESLVNGDVLEPADVRNKVKAQLKNKVPQLIEALNGRLRYHHRQMIRRHMNHLQYVEKEIQELEQEIERCIQSYQQEIELLDTIPGIDRDAAASIIAEIGPDMSVFPSDARLASWVGVCPANNESAGKKKSKRNRRGNKGLKSVLCQAGWAAIKKKNTRISAVYNRLMKRRGPQKANMGLAHLMV
jgi:transposase